MTFSRYNSTSILDFGAQYGTSRAVEFIRASIKDNTLARGKQIIVRGAERLDTIAAVEYGDGRYWWILAAASDVGWALQVPPGTILYAPSLVDISRIVS